MPDRESFSPQTCGHLIIGDFGLAYGSVGLELDRRDVLAATALRFKNRRDNVRISARRIIGFVS
jgi:hypothetical protein